MLQTFQPEPIKLNPAVKLDLPTLRKHKASEVEQLLLRGMVNVEGFRYSVMDAFENISRDDAIHVLQQLLSNDMETAKEAMYVLRFALHANIKKLADDITTDLDYS